MFQSVENLLTRGRVGDRLEVDAAAGGILGKSRGGKCADIKEIHVKTGAVQSLLRILANICTGYPQFRCIEC